LPGGGFHKLIDPHEARPIACQRVVDRVGMPMKKSRPRLAGAIAHITRDDAGRCKRFRQTRPIVIHSGTPSAAIDRVHLAAAAATIAMYIHRIDLV
jgi:hypothetical protein